MSNLEVLPELFQGLQHVGRYTLALVPQAGHLGLQGLEPPLYLHPVEELYLCNHRTTKDLCPGSVKQNRFSSRVPWWEE